MGFWGKVLLFVSRKSWVDFVTFLAEFVELCSDEYVRGSRDLEFGVLWFLAGWSYQSLVCLWSCKK